MGILGTLLLITIWFLIYLQLGKLTDKQSQRRMIKGKNIKVTDSTKVAKARKNFSRIEQKLVYSCGNILVSKYLNYGKTDAVEHNTFMKRQQQHLKVLKTKQPEFVGRRTGTEKRKFAGTKGNEETLDITSCYHDFLIRGRRRADYGECKPQVASSRACKLAKRLFYLDPKLSKCKTPGDGEICTIEKPKKRAKRADENAFIVKCTNTKCVEGSRHHQAIRILAVNPISGSLQSLGTFTSISAMEKSLREIIKTKIRQSNPFIILRCWIKNSNRTMSQLLYIDPYLTLIKRKPREKDLINVNILLIDSVSRNHFYRSFPRTVNIFRKWTNDPHRAPARIFDFKLFQAVHGHTFENMHALFTGTLFRESPMRRRQQSKAWTGTFFGAFRRVGYQTMWQEDLCWEKIWGLMLDLAAKDYKDLQEKLKKNFIDHTGLTFSSCEILTSNGIDSMFEDTPGDQICYNGEFQHSYLLQYMTDTLNAINADHHALPLLAYTALNVGHDRRARRVQTLDPALSDYVTALAHNENTLSVILADHGNTYSQFLVQTLEGHFEMFNPSLFIIVPNKVSDLLGHEAMDALSTNQHRLVTMIDLHHSLIALASPLKGRVTTKGVLVPISPNRTCNDIELESPNLCVCDAFENPVSNGTAKLAIVEFAIGELNNKIDEQLRASATNETKASPCRILRAVRYENVLVSRVNEILKTSMDIFVTAGDVVTQKEDLFYVEVSSVEIQDRFSLRMTLNNYERLFMYSNYSACADKRVYLKLCVCSLADHSHMDSHSYIGKENETRAAVNDTEGCVTLVSRNHYAVAFAYELLNSCVDKEFRLLVGATLANVKTSQPLPFLVFLKAESRRFIFSAKIYDTYWEGLINVIIISY